MIADRVARALAVALPDRAPTSGELRAASLAFQLSIAAKIASPRGFLGFGAPSDDAWAPACRALMEDWDPTSDDVGLVHEVLVAMSGDRRAKGAHYTPRALAEGVVERALAPLGGPLRVADLSCGGGAFLLAALRHARKRRVRIQLCGVDVDPEAVHATRLSLHLELGAWETDEVAVDVADALADPPRLLGALDAVVGNPPWVSYAGRAAQPLSAADRARYGAFSAFAGYRNLQALFVERACQLLRPGGRLGLVLPTSMSDLSGYAPSRRAHDAWCEVDSSLADLEDGGFEGVFQPCMALTSTRRASRAEAPVDAPWPLERRDLDAASLAFLRRVGSLSKLSPAHFGERGYQSLPRDKSCMRDEPFDGAVPLLTGTEVRPFQRLLAKTFVDPASLAQRLRSADQYAEVAVLVRQTARVPLAALSDGTAFRNSVLACFPSDALSASFLVAWLNAWPVRAFHYLAHRDARQGMPQLKIGHLRDLPAPFDGRGVRDIEGIGARLGRANCGISPSEQAELDDAVASALGLDDDERRVAQRVRVLVDGTKMRG